MRVALAVLPVLGALSVARFAFGTGGQAELAADPSTRAPFPGVLAYIAGYKRWPKHNRKPVPPRSSDPHDSVKNIYRSRSRPARSTMPSARSSSKRAGSPARDS